MNLLSRGACAGAVAIALMACSGMTERVWSEAYDFENECWKADDILEFAPDSITLTRNDIRKATVSIRYNDELRAEHLPVIVEIDSPKNRYYLCDTVSMTFLPLKERTADHARLGIFETSLTLPLRGRLMPGTKIRLYPADSEMEEKGIYSLTLEI